MAVALDLTLKKVIFAAADKDKDTCLQKAKEREGNLPLEAFDIFDERVKDKLSNWLAEHDILGSDNIGIVQSLFKKLASLFSLHESEIITKALPRLKEILE
jgi:hypothetical protein